MEHLLKLIAEAESNGDLNAVWNGIRTDLRPLKPLVEMTVQEVSDWQHHIARQVASTAAGRFQIVSSTLRRLIKEGTLAADDLFNEATQEAAAMALLVDRGLEACAKGKMSVSDFANNVAKEWASLPLVADITLPDGSKKLAGKSYYDNDGLNKARVKADEVVDAIRADLGIKSGITPAPGSIAAPIEKEAERLEARVEHGIQKLAGLGKREREQVLKTAAAHLADKGSRTVRDSRTGAAASGGIAGIAGLGWLSQWLPDNLGILNDLSGLLQQHGPLVLAVAGMAAFILFGRVVRWRAEDHAEGRHSGR